MMSLVCHPCYARGLGPVFGHGWFAGTGTACWARRGEARENEAMRVEGERGDEASEARRDEPQPATAADADADADAGASADASE